MRQSISAGHALRLTLSLWLASALAAVAAEGDVLRQLDHRDRQMRELQLKMQQHTERAAQPPASRPADLQLRALERNQQQRLRQLHELQEREAALGAVHEVERQRAGPDAAGELKRLEAERRLGSGRAAP